MLIDSGEMDSSTQTLLNPQSQDKLSYLPINGVDSVTVDACQRPIKKLNGIGNGSDCLYDDDDEGKPKLRRRNPENWKQNVRKRNKNKGLEYVKANGELCERKKLGPPCTCKEKCYVKIGMEACEKIFQNFWKLGDHALQNAYIAGCVRIFLPKHCYKKDGLPSRRFFSRNFHVIVNGVDTEVCKQAFLNMHAISNGRLDRLLKKKQEIGNTGFDERGRHSNKVNKIPIEKIRLVREHINGFRKRAGFTGKRKPKKVELLPGLLNIRTMYRNYREEMTAKGHEPVCEYRYRKIFHSDFHLDFGKTVVTTAAASPGEPPRQQQQQQQQTQNNLTANQTLTRQSDKLPDRTCERNGSARKMENFPGSDLQTANVDAQMIPDAKDGEKANTSAETMSTVYAQLEPSDGSAKEFHVRTAELTPYVLPQEVFRLDYASYNPQQSQQHWIFPNQN